MIFMSRRSGISSYLGDLAGDTKKFVDGLLDRVSDLDREVRQAARRALDNEKDHDKRVADMRDEVRRLSRQLQEFANSGPDADSGGGAESHGGISEQIDELRSEMRTLSKALGAAGGFIAGSAELGTYLRNRARSFIFDTALPPPTAAAALAALRIVEREPERPVRARRLATRLAAGLRAAGYDVPDPAAAVVPVVIGAPEAALNLSARLLDAGILVTAIRPPTVPEGTSRLRVTVMATHSDTQIDRAVFAFAAARP
jgi:hypothetical protein